MLILCCGHLVLSEGPILYNCYSTYIDWVFRICQAGQLTGDFHNQAPVHKSTQLTKIGSNLVKCLAGKINVEAANFL